MKIGILTQPLVNNYGGTLQNYALQQVLKKLGHDPITIDYIPKSSLIDYLLACLKTMFLFFIPSKRRSFRSHPRRKLRNAQFDKFTRTYILTTKTVSRLRNSLIDEYGIDMLIVGSDQVWRPRYNPYVEDMFFKFVKNDNLRRLSYAASFGTDEWEYTPKQTILIRALINKFMAVSVREESGIKFCESNLSVKAQQVLDPTLLLEEADYRTLCKNIPEDKNKYILAYILDVTQDKEEEIARIEDSEKMNVKYCHAENDATLTVEEWIARFRDASYVITDSFHGTVFSIIFGKPFTCLKNSTRGSSRFDTLLSIYNNGHIEKKQKESLGYLNNILNLNK